MLISCVMTESQERMFPILSEESVPRAVGDEAEDLDFLSTQSSLLAIGEWHRFFCCWEMLREASQRVEDIRCGDGHYMWHGARFLRCHRVSAVGHVMGQCYLVSRNGLGVYFRKVGQRQTGAVYFMRYSPSPHEDRYLCTQFRDLPLLGFDLLLLQPQLFSQGYCYFYQRLLRENSQPMRLLYL